MISLRPKFSLRSVLLAITVVAVVLYVFVARPTMLANQFVAAIARKDLAAARAMTTDVAAWDLMMDPPKSNKAVYLTAWLQPREWRDLRSSQRRIMLGVERFVVHYGTKASWAEGVDVVVHLNGIEIKPSHLPNGIAAELPPPIPKKAPSLSPN